MSRTCYDRVKRAFDVVVGSTALLMSLPVQGVVALIVWRCLGRPVLFRQVRPGWHAEPFELLKFRSMRLPDAEHQTDAERLTPLGRALRATSLDELPSLWNIVRGDLSLVGPRPLLVDYLDRYSPRQARRHEVRPGLTGLAQVSGRNALDWESRLELDVRYVEQRGLGLDLKIILRTIGLVVARTGVSEEGQATMTEFQGTPRPGEAG